MKLSLVLLRKDLWRLWPVLLLWLGLVILALVRHLTGLAYPEWHASGSFRGASPDWLLLLGVEGLLVVLAALVIMEDAPAREERFLATRPMPIKSRWLGKTLFLAGCLILPMALVEAIAVAAHGASVSIWLQAVLIKLIFVSALVFAVTGIASVYGSPLRVVIAAALGFGTMMLVAALTSKGRAMGSPNLWQWIQVALVIGLLCYACPQRLRRFLGGWLFPILGGSLLALVIMFTPFKSWPHSTASSGLQELKRDQAIAGAGKITMREYPAHVSMEGWLMPNMLAHPADWDVMWQDARSRTTTRLRFGNSRRTTYQPAICSALAEAFGDVRVRSDDWATTHASIAVQLGSFRPDAAELSQPQRYEANLLAHAARWRVLDHTVCELGNQLAGDGARWTIAGITWGESNGRLVKHIGLKGTRLRLATDGSLTARTGRVMHAYRFFVYLPDEGYIVQLRGHEQLIPHGITAVTQHVVNLREESGDYGIKLERLPENARLVVCAAESIGQTTIAWKSPPVVATHYREFHMGHEHKAAKELNAAEMAEAYERLPQVKPEELSQSEAALRLYELLSIVEQAKQSLPRNHDIARELSRFARYHPELLMNALEGSQSRTQWALQRALTDGLSNDQRDMVIERFQRTMSLLFPVILERDWVEAARPVLLQKLGVEQIDHTMAAALSRGADEETVTQILRTAASSPRKLAGFLDVPVLKDGARETLRALWQRYRHAFGRGGSYEEILYGALKAGDHQALADVHRTVSIIPPDQFASYSAHRINHSVIAIPFLESPHHRSTREVLTGLLEYTPEDFRWDPLHRRFHVPQS